MPNAPGPGDSATWPAPTGHPNDPRTDDSDDVLSEDDARTQAADEFIRTPTATAQGLAEWCGVNLPISAPRFPSRTPVNLKPLCEPDVLTAKGRDDFDPLGQPIYILFAVAFGGCVIYPVSAMRALKAMRERLIEANEEHIAERAAESCVVVEPGFREETEVGIDWK